MRRRHLGEARHEPATKARCSAKLRPARAASTLSNSGYTTDRVSEAGPDLGAAHVALLRTADHGIGVAAVSVALLIGTEANTAPPVAGAARTRVGPGRFRADDERDVEVAAGDVLRRRVTSQGGVLPPTDVVSQCASCNPSRVATSVATVGLAAENNVDSIVTRCTRSATPPASSSASCAARTGEIGRLHDRVALHDLSGCHDDGRAGRVDHDRARYPVRVAECLRWRR